MELKAFQKKVIRDLQTYLELFNEYKSCSRAFRSFWADKAVPSLGEYKEILLGVPNICFKVPTGGGKTFLACNAVRPIFDALPTTKIKAVVWLVPSDAILTQTIKALKDPKHPYRQKLDVDFGSRVEVYTKAELLNGQNFNVTTVTEQLSVMVLSYDSFRGRGEGLKAYKENSNLVEFSNMLGKPELPIEKAEESALFQVINQLSPLVIVDESHHARSELSLEMLKNFNPCFVLDLTATPRKDSNVISYVDAVQLKAESMVKLPVIVYNRNSQTDVLIDAIDLRNRLEEYAEEEMQRTGRYIRPIALFQAQPKGKTDATTFTLLRERLVTAGIPEEQIAIRTGDVNELKNVNLLSQDCPIRYIITVNALKEGWDCPFAYILASLANRTSLVDVEQILGRILRLPNTTQNTQAALNLSYVLTSSNDFDSTVRQIIRGLNSAGFSARDYRTAELSVLKPESTDEEPVQTELVYPSDQNPATTPVNTSAPGSESQTDDDLSDLDDKRLQDAISQMGSGSSSGGQSSQGKQSGNSEQSSGSGLGNALQMIQEAESADKEYQKANAQNQSGNQNQNGESSEVQEKMTNIRVQTQFEDDIRTIRIPQFFEVIPEGLFTDGNHVLLEKEHLYEGFTLSGKAYDIDFKTADEEIAQIDVLENEGGLPKVFKLTSAEQHYFKEHFSKLPTEAKQRQSKAIILNHLNRLDYLRTGELEDYVDLIIRHMDKEQIAAIENSPMACAQKIRRKIESLLDEHAAATFHQWVDTERIKCLPSYQLPEYIHPKNSTDVFGKSLYRAEETMDSLEKEIVMELTALENVRWWHRNISRQGFRINGFINHYPDIMVMTNSGKLILLEPKGGYLDNSDSKAKIELGKAWRLAAGNLYRYYMVFANNVQPLPGALNVRDLIETLKQL